MNWKDAVQATGFAQKTNSRGDVIVKSIDGSQWQVNADNVFTNATRMQISANENREDWQSLQRGCTLHIIAVQITARAAAMVGTVARKTGWKGAILETGWALKNVGEDVDFVVNTQGELYKIHRGMIIKGGDPKGLSWISIKADHDFVKRVLFHEDLGHKARIVRGEITPPSNLLTKLSKLFALKRELKELAKAVGDGNIVDADYLTELDKLISKATELKTTLLS